MSLTAIEKRVLELEGLRHQYDTKLPDGTYFRTAWCFKLMRTALKIERDMGREPIPSDFTPDEWQLWQKFAILENPGKISPLVEMTCQIAKRFCYDN